MDTYSIVTNEKFGTLGLRKSINSSPNYNSAVILNNLVKAYDISNTAIAKSNNIKNFALSYNDDLDVLKLNYGLKNISPVSFSNIEDILILGKGLIQKTSFYETPDIIENLFGFSIYDIYNGTESLSNCYLLGAVYLTFDNETVDFDFQFAKPINQSEILIFHKDTKLENVKNILLFSNEIEFTSQSENSILLYKFILDIESFQNERRLDRYFFYLYDLRMPEGLFGLTEETLYSVMIVDLLRASDRIENAVNAELIYIKDIINKWISLDSWEPSFTGYWQVSENPMPEELKSFINFNFGIEI